MKITAEYAPKFKDYYEADIYFRREDKDRKNVEKVSAYFIFFLSIVFLILNSFFLAILLFSLGLLFLFSWDKYLIVKMNYNRQLRHIKQEKMIFSENVIEYFCDGVQTEIPWNSYGNFLETPNTVVLIYNSFSHYAVIPKSCLNEFELVDLLNLLSSKFR